MERREKSLVEKMVYNGQLPLMLYKYRSLAEDSKKWTLQILQDCSLFFANPNSFNDPFDCKIYPTEKSLEELARNLSIRQKVYEGLSSEVILENLKSIGSIDNYLRRTVDDVMNKKGVCCMTAKADNILMWSHYAGSHQGICLAFEVLKDPSFFVFPIKMNYSSNYPEVSLSDSRSYTEALLKSKYKDWSYEEEIRIYKETSSCYNFNPIALTKILFGCKTSQSDIEQIKEIVGSNPKLSHVQLCKMRIDDKSYKLTPVEL